VLIVMHTRAETNGVLPEILNRSTDLPVAFATNAEPLRKGRIYVARPDFQLLIEDARLMVVRGPRENGFRPAIDPLFRTAARWHGPRVVGVILSGALDDGTYGLSQIKQHGGVAIVQNPEEAVIPSMPSSAIRQVAVDYVLTASEIPALIVQLTEEPQIREGVQSMAPDDEPESALPNEQTPVREMEQLFGAPSALTCPDCGGALWEVEDGRLVRYRCHVGHQYAPDSLAAEQRDAVEGALWSAVRVLEEHAELRLRMARRADAAGLSVVSEGFAEGARDSHRQAQEIRALLFAGGEAPDSLEEEAAKPAVEKGTRKAKRSTH
jgi:two-component system chemotaxis response regulator CheB